MSAKTGRAPDELTDLSDTSWKGVLKRSVKEFQNDNLSDWAAALTYRGVLTLAPALLVMVSLLGLLGKSTTDQLVQNIGQLAPGGVRTVLQQIIANVQSRNSAGFAAILGLLLACGPRRATSPPSCGHRTRSMRWGRGARSGRPCRCGWRSRWRWLSWACSPR